MQINRKILTLRCFKNYHPRQIAKYVKAYFNGRFFIVGLGRFRIINGKVEAYQNKKTDKRIIIIVGEINRMVKELSRTRMLEA